MTQKIFVYFVDTYLLCNTLTRRCVSVSVCVGVIVVCLRAWIFTECVEFIDKTHNTYIVHTHTRILFHSKNSPKKLLLRLIYYMYCLICMLCVQSNWKCHKRLTLLSYTHVGGFYFGVPFENEMCVSYFPWCLCIAMLWTLRTHKLCAIITGPGIIENNICFSWTIFGFWTLTFRLKIFSSVCVRLFVLASDFTQ